MSDLIEVSFDRGVHTVKVNGRLIEQVTYTEPRSRAEIDEYLNATDAEEIRLAKKYGIKLGWRNRLARMVNRWRRELL